MRIAVLPLLRDDAAIESQDEFPAILEALARAQQYNAQIFTMSVNGGEPHGPDENGNVDLAITGAQELTGYLRADHLNQPGNPPALDEDGMLSESVLPLSGYLKKAELDTAGNPPPCSKTVCFLFPSFLWKGIFPTRRWERRATRLLLVPMGCFPKRCSLFPGT